VETKKNRLIRVLKGRGGEVGKFLINWDFNLMDFTQLDPPLESEKPMYDEVGPQEI
jgi:hypothetical protein